jgi:hypothetical protein
MRTICIQLSCNYTTDDSSLQRSVVLVLRNYSVGSCTMHAQRYRAEAMIPLLSRRKTVQSALHKLQFLMRISLRSTGSDSRSCVKRDAVTAKAELRQLDSSSVRVVVTAATESAGKRS